MRALTRLVVPALALTALAQPAVAATRCVGEQSVQHVCLVTPSYGVGSDTYCVYTGGSRCTEVDVPTTTGSGPIYVYCGGIVPCHQEILDGCTILGVLTCQ